MPENKRINNKWLSKYYKLGLWFETMVFFAILIFSSNGGVFCESKSIDVIFKYSTSVKLKKPSCDKSLYYGYVEKEGKWVENPCPILLVECAWWSEHHEAKDRESIYLRNNNVMVRSMALVGRPVYRPSSPYGQHGMGKCVGRRMSVNHALWIEWCVCLTFETVNHKLGGCPDVRGWAKCVGQRMSVNHTSWKKCCVGLTWETCNVREDYPPVLSR